MRDTSSQVVTLTTANKELLHGYRSPFFFFFFNDPSQNNKNRFSALVPWISEDCTCSLALICLGFCWILKPGCRVRCSRTLYQACG